MVMTLAWSPAGHTLVPSGLDSPNHPGVPRTELRRWLAGPGAGHKRGAAALRSRRADAQGDLSL
jgi:hypothetical protein